MTQRFYANPQTRRVSPNGAISFGPGGSFDCLGTYSRINNCPIDGTELRLTCYATGYADTFFSVPACTRYRGRYISGFFTSNGQFDPVFNPHLRHYEHLGLGRTEELGTAGALTLKTADYIRCGGSGPQGANIRELSSEYYVRAQLTAFDPEKLRAYLAELGAWSDTELSNHWANQNRALWVAACNMRERGE